MTIKSRQIINIPLPGSLVPGPLIMEMLAPLKFEKSHPLKLSVTQLVDLQAEAEEETPQLKRQSFEEMSLQTQRLMPRSQVPGIQRGIATHKALGSLSLSALPGLEHETLDAAIEQALELLVSEGRLEEAQLKAVDVRCIADFYHSDLGRRMRLSGEVHREWPFSLVAEQGLIVQGVIDCCFMEEDGWVLIDYKTDRAPAQVIESRYRDQLRWYMRALSDITGIPVKAAYLYALDIGELIPITQTEVIRYLPAEEVL
ncbi:MAG: hypothetical protein GX858_07385 [Clostridiales bacterium]|nr:hypothetical protein [Clostridiales bacterium]